MSVTITSDINLKDVSSFNSNGEPITINDGATLTITYFRYCTSIKSKVY